MALPRSWLASFPDDVVEEILTRLPPKPLVRFRCVSRCWKSNIADPKFIEKHFTVNKAKSLSDYYNNNVGYLLWQEQGIALHWFLENELCTVVCNTDGSLTEISRWMVPGFFILSGFCNGIFYSVNPPAIPYNLPTQASESVRTFHVFSIMTVLRFALMNLRFLLLKTTT